MGETVLAASGTHAPGMLIPGARAWGHDNNKGGVVAEYFPSSGAIQATAIFPVLS